MTGREEGVRGHISKGDGEEAEPTRVTVVPGIQNRRRVLELEAGRWEEPTTCHTLLVINETKLTNVNVMTTLCMEV